MTSLSLSYFYMNILSNIDFLQDNIDEIATIIYNPFIYI